MCIEHLVSEGVVNAEGMDQIFRDAIEVEFDEKEESNV